ncbi:hypothetical protein RirG_023280 [Rhizophagus irregularis DAOM 197198w]|uniref:Uncharacterized protein n=1 Tax=Rhizophagus irregularis (strain DAOM 197198w) TaxID=1432141 RepID=A0A015LXQ8_RHIIW|nr:hypothetical protein RirG_023280 [Rhizophagus irregularis DAOM 197198w]
MSRKEEFSEDDLNEFENLITIWSCEFVNVFARFNPSNLRLPKLHSWRYHVISAIRQFGAINGYTSETYETLHKFYVKNPYRKSNKKEVMNQILNRV